MAIIRAKMEENQEAEATMESRPIHGDILEAILSHVPLVHLVPASRVCKSWNAAAHSTHLRRLKPWLVVHTQSNRSPYPTSTHAYDPSSRAWLQVSRPSIPYISALRSSGSNLAYMLSPARLSFSSDPLHLTWHHADAPFVWRNDPIVSLVDKFVVVAGGTCDFEDDPVAVEVYDLESRKWSTCESMPASLNDSAASTWLSVATDHEKLFVAEKYSGETYSFDPNTMAWDGPYDLRPSAGIFYSLIGCSKGRLILIGLIGTVDEMKGLKIWEVNRGTFACREIGEMPAELFERLVGGKEMFRFSSISVCMAGELIYVCNASDVGEVIVCEFAGDGGRSCQWWSVRNVVAGDHRNLKERFVFGCSEIGLVDLERAMRCENWKFTVRT